MLFEFALHDDEKVYLDLSTEAGRQAWLNARPDRRGEGGYIIVLTPEREQEYIAALKQHLANIPPEETARRREKALRQYEQLHAANG